MLKTREAKTCGTCQLWLSKDCPACEYKTAAENRVACPQSQEACEKFTARGSPLILPNLDGELLTKIHPAIDFVEDEAYIGLTVPCKYGDGEEKETYCIILNDREIVPAEKNHLKEQGLRLAFFPILTDNRWSLGSVKTYIEGKDSFIGLEEVYTSICEPFKAYIEMPEPVYYDFLTLWVIGTYLHPLFNSYPYVYIGGIKRAGKTKTLTVASLMAFNSIFSGNMSTASLYRLIQNNRCTLLIDETEKLVNPERAQDFRNILLSGYKRGEKAYRIGKNSKDKLVPEPFEVYSPKMLANIRGLEDILADRCIKLIILRGLNKEVTNREVNTQDGFWQEVRDKLYLFTLQHWCKIREAYEAYDGQDSGLNQRELELWRPILVLARYFGVYEPILEFAKRKAEERRVEDMTETGDAVLMQVLVEEVKLDDYYPVRTLRERMEAKFDDVQNWLKNEWVGRALQRFGFSEKRRVGSGVEYRLTVKGVSSLAERLGGVSSEGCEGSAPPTDMEKEKIGSEGSKKLDESMRGDGGLDACTLGASQPAQPSPPTSEAAT